MVLRPDHIIKDVSEIDLDKLLEKGIDTLIIDLDNTIVPRDVERIDERYRMWINRARTAGFRVFIVSNNFNERVRKALDGVEIDGLIAPAGKPFLKRIRKMFNEHEINPSSTVFVGDQLFTDILAAKRLGCSAYLVIPISDYDLPHTRLLRKLERILLKKWERNVDV